MSVVIVVVVTVVENEEQSHVVRESMMRKYHCQKGSFPIDLAVLSDIHYSKEKNKSRFVFSMPEHLEEPDFIRF